MVDTAANPFEGLTIERAEPLPKRQVAGREAIPNPFLDAVRDSYAEALTDQDKAVRGIHVPVDKKNTSVRTVERKDKTGAVVQTQSFEQHPNVTTALYLIRQAAIKQDIGVRIVVDYSVNDNGEHTFNVKSGKVLVRFLGQKKKEQKKNKANDAQAQSAA